MYKNILFDVDGTLIDTEKTIIKSWQKTLKDLLNLTIPTEDLFYILGIPGTKAVEVYANNSEQFQKLSRVWEENDRKMFYYSKLFQDIESTLELLNDNNLQLGIVTSRTDEELQFVFKHFPIEKYFNIFVTTAQTKLHKPHPDPILKAIDLLQIDPQKTVYIGDSIYDLQCAHSAKIDFALAGWGAKEDPMFNDSEYILNSPKDLINLAQ